MQFESRPTWPIVTYMKHTDEWWIDFDKLVNMRSRCCVLQHLQYSNQWSSGTWSSSETTTFPGHPDKTSHGLVSTHLFAPKACSILMSIPQVWPHQLCAIHAVLWLQRNDWRPIWQSSVSDLNGLWFIYTVKKKIYIYIYMLIYMCIGIVFNMH